MNSIAEHYDKLIDEGQDPVHDPQPLVDYMNKWDGQVFLDKLQLSGSASCLEIGVGTGRIAVKTAALCKSFTGIDISEKTVEKAIENLSFTTKNKPELICADFLEYDSDKTFDVIYSSLTFLHFQDKQRAFDKVAKLLNKNGRFVLSIDKNQDEFIDTGSSKIKVFPDNPEDTVSFASKSSLVLYEETETEFAYIFVFSK